jgi:hypothetical protein
MKTIIGICGEKGSGKSTLASKVYRGLEPCMILPMAGVAKQCVEYITGVEMDERQPDGSYDYSQKAKQKLLPSGTQLGVFIRDFAEAVRHIDPLIWIDAAHRKIDEGRHRYIIIPDIRIPAESKWLNDLNNSDEYESYLFRINPDQALRSKNSAGDARETSHHTETSFLQFPVDKSYMNNFGISSVDKIASDILSIVCR